MTCLFLLSLHAICRESSLILGKWHVSLTEIMVISDMNILPLNWDFKNHYYLSENPTKDENKSKQRPVFDG